MVVAHLETSGWWGLGWFEEGLVPLLLPQERSLSLEGSNAGVSALLQLPGHLVVLSRNWSS